jgi:hypothetical protein
MVTVGASDLHGYCDNVDQYGAMCTPESWGSSTGSALNTRAEWNCFAFFNWSGNRIQPFYGEGFAVGDALSPICAQQCCSADCDGNTCDPGSLTACCGSICDSDAGSFATVDWCDDNAAGWDDGCDRSC